MTTKAVADITYEDIDAAGAVVFFDETDQLVVMLAPWVKNFKCGACGNTYERSTYGNHWSDRKDSATGEPVPRCIEKKEWEAFKKDKKRVRLLLFPKRFVWYTRYTRFVGF